MKAFLYISLFCCGAATTLAQATAPQPTPGNVIFIHPDGAGVNAWTACRMLHVGPDANLAWDRLPEIGIYRGHMKNCLTSSSHGGATSHAYGVKVDMNSYGMDRQKPIKSASGFDGSLMQEALAAGKAVGVVNSGHIGEPGTGVFLASHPGRGDVTAIAAKILASGAQVILCGGEQFMLPAGAKGVHGIGGREDGRDLFKEAADQGYTIVRTREELLSLDLSKVSKLLGVFAAKNTFNDQNEASLADRNLPHFDPDAPTIGEMTDVALKILSQSETGFFLVAEEEGSDNFGNYNNAGGVLESLRRADEAILVATGFLETSPKTFLITAADSDAGGMQVICPPKGSKGAFKPGQALPAKMPNGAPLDGPEGTGSTPFLSAPDRAGETFAFGISYATLTDVSGGVVAKAAGYRANELPANVDNTDIYAIMHRILFGLAPVNQ